MLLNSVNSISLQTLVFYRVLRQLFQNSYKILQAIKKLSSILKHLITLFFLNFINISFGLIKSYIQYFILKTRMELMKICLLISKMMKKKVQRSINKHKIWQIKRNKINKNQRKVQKQLNLIEQRIE